MKIYALATALAVGLFVPIAAFGATCPNLTNGFHGCNEVITADSGGNFSLAVVNASPYDGSDDNYIGFQNNSSASVSSIALNGNGTNIFGFEGDGITGYGIAGNAQDPSGYGGPNAYFTNIVGDTGTVNFITAIAPGGFGYFSLEEAPNVSVPITVGPGAVTPEPSSLILLGTGMLGLAETVRRKLHS
ncbi:MAG: PEP-CTERM sorting domain-containing protein [Edaphobacter sp.]